MKIGPIHNIREDILHCNCVSSLIIWQGTNLRYLNIIIEKTCIHLSFYNLVGITALKFSTGNTGWLKWPPVLSTL